MAKETAALLDQIPGTVFTLGDNAYPSGTARDYADCYHPTWGRHRARTRPSLGNHDYKSHEANPYFQYFGENAGPPGLGYFSYGIGEWHVVSLNSNIEAKSWGWAQENWLRANLNRNPSACVVAYWHTPRFSYTGGRRSENAYLNNLFQILYQYGVSVLISGHDHLYERFSPQDPYGKADVNGVRQFIVGTGGDKLYGDASASSNSEVHNRTTYGVLKLTLKFKSYDWEFVPIAGQTFRDSGTSNCSRKAPFKR